jgi:hypothetical protein
MFSSCAKSAPARQEDKDFWSFAFRKSQTHEAKPLARINRPPSATTKTKMPSVLSHLTRQTLANFRSLHFSTRAKLPTSVTKNRIPSKSRQKSPHLLEKTRSSQRSFVPIVTPQPGQKSNVMHWQAKREHSTYSEIQKVPDPLTTLHFSF